MLNILAISENGEGYGLATKLAKEKNFVKFYTSSSTGTGFRLPKKVEDINPEDEEDLVICLQNTPNIQAGVKGVVDLGRIVMGSGGVLSKLTDGEFVEKFKGLIRDVPEEGENEYAVYRFFGINGYLPFYILNHAQRRIGEGEKGSFCQSTGNVVRVQDEFEFGYAFEDVEGILKKVGFVGLVGFRFKGSRVLEFIPYLDLGMLYAFFELCHFSFTEMLMSLLYELEFTGKFRSGVGMSVMVSLPPFPFPDFNLRPLDELVVEKEEYMKHFVLEDVVKTPECFYTGSFGLLGWSTAYGVNLREAKRRVYRTIKNVVLNPELQYRKDIGEDTNAFA